jgi:hypothetical protein
VSSHLTLKYSPSLRRKTLAEANKHITALGEIVWAANLLHDEWFRLFLIALSLERPDEVGAEIRFHEHALAIWHIIQSDSAQREMALKAISTMPTELKLSHAIRRFTWAKGISDKLGKYRNIVAHAPISFTVEKSGAKFVSAPRFAGRGVRPAHQSHLALIKGMSFWRMIRDDLFSLFEYVEHVNLQVQRIDYGRRGIELLNAPESWPDRPRLRSLPHLLAIEKKMGQLAQKPKRRPRRRPSRAKP